MKSKIAQRLQDGKLDDIVVTNVRMFRAEQLTDDLWWLACYLQNGETISWHLQNAELTTQEMPKQYEDFDANNPSAKDKSD